MNRGLGISTLANAPALKKKCLNKIILRQRTFHAINQLGKTFPILFDFLPLFLQKFYNKMFSLLLGKWEAALLLAIKLCPISPWRNKLVWLGHIYLATELYITTELEDIWVWNIHKAYVIIHVSLNRTLILGSGKIIFPWPDEYRWKSTAIEKGICLERVDKTMALLVGLYY